MFLPLLFVSHVAASASPFGRLPIDLLPTVAECLSDVAALRGSCKFLSEKIPRLEPLDLTEYYSRLYIRSERFRAIVGATLVRPRQQVRLHLSSEIRDPRVRGSPRDLTDAYITDPRFKSRVDALLADPRQQIRLNLGETFIREYFTNDDFRLQIDRLVARPLEQIWSEIEFLDLDESPIQDIGQLAALVNLRTLVLGRTQVQDLSPLKKLRNLEVLCLNESPIKDISPLKELTSLNWLGLSDTLVEDVQPLEQLTSLGYLHIARTPVKNVRLLDGLVAAGLDIIIT